MNRCALVATVWILAGCDEPSPSGASPPAASSVASTTTTSVAPTSTTSSAPPAASNRPPSVRMTGDAGCHPRRDGDTVDPCTVSFRAEASDPDGDVLSYRWSGCASGQAEEASCVIDRLERVTATVEVTDGRGGSARVSRTAEGTNRSPTIGNFQCFYLPSQNPGAPDCGGQTCPPPIPTDGIGTCWDPSFNARDDEGDGEGCGPVIPSGACHGPIGIFECGGVAVAFSFEFRTGADEGDCELQISISDDWGATASTSVRVPVRNYP